ncbi:MAG: hypothetical protein ABR865_01170 [Terracidiphilus sp.]|jgi:hypothetical protein
MSKVNVKNGSPFSSEHLCRNCWNGQVTTGYRESDVWVICTNSSPARMVPFPVEECTDFWDRNRPNWDQMEDLAISFSETRTRPIRGFAGTGFSQLPAAAGGDDEGKQDEAAITR